MKLRNLIETPSYNAKSSELKDKLQSSNSQKDLADLMVIVVKSFEARTISAQDFDELSAAIGRKQSKSNYSK